MDVGATSILPIVEMEKRCRHLQRIPVHRISSILDQNYCRKWATVVIKREYCQCQSWSPSLIVNSTTGDSTQFHLSPYVSRWNQLHLSSLELQSQPNNFHYSKSHTNIPYCRGYIHHQWCTKLVLYNKVKDSNFEMHPEIELCGKGVHTNRWCD